MHTSAPSLQSSLTSPHTKPIFQTILPFTLFSTFFHHPFPPFCSFSCLHPPTLSYTTPYLSFLKSFSLSLTTSHSLPLPIYIFLYAWLAYNTKHLPFYFFRSFTISSSSYLPLLCLSLTQRKNYYNWGTTLNKKWKRGGVSLKEEED